MEGICIKVESRHEDYMDFTVSLDDQSLYRFEQDTGKMSKLFGLGNYGKAVRGKKRKAVETLAKSVFENGLPFGVAI